MPLGVSVQERSPDQPIQSIATGISGVLVDTPRGIPNKQVLCTSYAKFVESFGYYDPDKYSHYSVRGAFNNGARQLWAVRVVGDDARYAGGADGSKVAESKAQLSDGAANAILNLVAVNRGTAGGLVNVTIETSASVNKTSVALANTYDVTLTLAQTSAWRKCARVCETVINGHAHQVISGAAVEAVNDALCFYASAAGVDGNSCSVEVVDSGGAGPTTYAYDPTGYELTIDLVGLTPTAAAVVIGVNALAGEILAYELGTGATTWTAAVAQTYLTGGITGVPALLAATYGGTGLTQKVTMTRTYLAGTGAVTAAGFTFTDSSTLDALTCVGDYVVPGDILVILNGANIGAYEVTGVNSETQITLDRFDTTSWTGWGTSQANCLYAILGSDSRYGQVAATLNSPGVSGDEFEVALSLEKGGLTLKAVVTVTDGDNAERILETFTGLSPIPTNPDYINTRFSADSDWVNFVANVGKTLSTGTGTSLAGVGTLTEVGATFVTDGVAAGDIVIVTSATTAADVHVYEILSVDSETQLTMTMAFVGAQADCVYTVVGDDDTGSEFLALVGTSGMTITFGGGVDADALKADYEGSSVDKSGVYALNKISSNLFPNKFWVPEEPQVVDGSGIDATSALAASMADYASSSMTSSVGKLVYIRVSDFGLTPSNAISAVDSEAFDNKYLIQYWPWGKVTDPLTGTWKWCPLAGHMVGLYDRVDFSAEGMHKAPAGNIVLRDVFELEYEADLNEADSLNEVHLNPIINLGGIRAYGDRIMTSDSRWMWIHKRLVTIRTVTSIVNSLMVWVPFAVNAVDLWARVKMQVQSYLSKYDRRKVRNGAFENKSDPTAVPFYVTCDSSNNSLSSQTVNIEAGWDIVDTVERAILNYGIDMNNNSFTVDEG